jgi:hypothetical protein
MNDSDEGGREDPVFERGMELLRRAGPTPAMPALKRRVWTSLERADTWGRQQRWRSRPRHYAVAAAIVFVAGTAGAVIVHRRGPGAPVPQPAAAPAPSSRPAVHTQRASTAAPTPAADIAPAPRPVVARPSAVRRAPVGELKRSSAGDGPRAASAAGERTEVLDAMIALRRDHDPVRAGALLDRYLGAHPRGALREEALALAIESAAARGDERAARAWATTYEASYPGGRFGAFARSHLEP